MNMLKKQYKASVPLNVFGEEKLKLFVYGTAYIDFAKLQNKYDLIDVDEHFEDNLINNTRTLFVSLTLQEKEIN